MMCLGAEIGITVVGLYYLITGKAKINKTHQLVGTPVRILGVICLLAIPLALGIGIFIGFLAGLGIVPESILQYSFIGDAVSIVVILIVATIYYYAVKDQAVEIGS